MNMEQIGRFDWPVTVANLRLDAETRKWVNTLSCRGTSPSIKAIFLAGPLSSIHDCKLHVPKLTQALANHLGVKRVDVYLELEATKDSPSVLRFIKT